MIKATVIHGSEAVKEFDRTGKYPPKEWLEENGCSVVEKTFTTEAEYQAYCEALEDNDGYDDWRIHGVVNLKQNTGNHLYEQLKSLTQQYINKLSNLPHKPDGWLPHVVYVEEEGDYPVYTRYKLTEIRSDGSCSLVNDDSGEVFTDRHLYEINIDWLDTIYRWYFECCAEQNIIMEE